MSPNVGDFIAGRYGHNILDSQLSIFILFLIPGLCLAHRFAASFGWSRNMKIKIKRKLVHHFFFPVSAQFLFNSFDFGLDRKKKKCGIVSSLRWRGHNPLYY